MNLDDTLRFKTIDKENMLGHIDGLPVQLKQAWMLGCQFPTPSYSGFTSIVVAGMGGSAIGADLLGHYLSDRLPVPLIIHRDYGLPAFAMGSQTLVIVSSHSGNTEESLSAFEQACERKCQIMVISTGGEIQKQAIERGITYWKFDHIGQPRTAVGFSFGLILAFLFRIGLTEDPSRELENAIQVMQALQEKIKADEQVSNNPAKRLAGQMIDRHITIFASGFMAPVARRWKSQINEVSKAVASFEYLPEADHNTLAGIENPQRIKGHELAIFLNASSDHPRNRERVEKTREIFMLEGIGTDHFTAKGETRLAQMWSTLLFGDYVSYYLAMAYETDPTPILPITELKENLKHSHTAY